jgi:hypothetical protein
MNVALGIRAIEPLEDALVFTETGVHQRHRKRPMRNQLGRQDAAHCLAVPPATGGRVRHATVSR